MVLDIHRLRADIPAYADPAGPPPVFLDSAGSSLPPRVVIDTITAHLRRESEIGGYRAASERLGDLADVKAAIGALINADPAAIALSDSASRAWSDFFYAVPLHPGDRILISGSDYASNAIAALQRARATGATVEPIPSDATGRIDLAALAEMLDDRVKVVSLLHVPTNGGLVNPVADATRIAHRVGALVLLDACQSAGQLPLDVAELGVDAMSATGRKWLRGPRGTGFLYVRPQVCRELEPSRLDLHSAAWTGPQEYRIADDATRFEFWECDVAARLGLGAAVRYLLDLGPDNVFAAVAANAGYLREHLPAVRGATVRDLGTEHSGIVSFTIDGLDPIEIRDRLRESDITVTVSHRGSTLLDMSARHLDSVVRASPHCFVTTAELDRFLAAVERLAPPR
ncbi:putative pyridoxal-phosphate-dependent protein EgtE [Nocardia nova SH22a]|uniref:Probable hercynylcysteine sulfoxide lyase n=1 Tax=Nocardia nova SH22a TaxID=1415166 RepID=W5TW67_9NOCA|nr:putative pyridoxal-phosphate-dependent protein EgtE [Nocardia nova SH22a]